VTRLEVGDLEGAESDALATISALPNNPSGYCILGTVHSRRGDFEAGLEAFGLALAVDPNYAGAFLERALLHEKLGDTARAMEDHDRAVALSAEGTAHYNRGNLRLALNDLTGAEEDFSEALRLNPKDAQALLNRGSVRALKGDVEGCAEDFEQAAKLYPQRAAARMKWGVLLLNLERKAEALSELQAALACAPEDWPHRAEIEALVSTLD
jgi:tetratricopeptide (TPR) repeat protein